MQKRACSFQKCSLLLPFLFLTTIGCSGKPTLWGRDLGEVRRRLEAADFAFLRQIDWGKQNPEDGRRLGEGAGFYLYHIFRQQGLHEQADRVLEQEWMRGKGVWKEEAGLLWLERLAADHDPRRLEKEARRFLSALPASAHRPRAQRLLLQAAFDQERDEEVLREVAALPPARLAEDPQLRLYQAVSSCRRGVGGWEELFVSLFLEVRRGKAHQLALAFLEKGGLLSRFPGPLQALFRAKVDIYLGLPGRAIERLEGALLLLPLERLGSSPLVEELGLAYFSAEQVERGALFLSEHSSRLPPAAQLQALEMAGRLYRRMGDAERAGALLQLVVGRTQDPRQRDRAIWYRLDLQRQQGFAALLPEVVRTAPLWHNPGYFSDILDSGITELAAARDWGALERLYRGIEPAASAGLQARLAFLLARANRFPDPAGRVPRTPRDLLRRVRALQPDGYYGILASVLLGEDPPAWGGGEEGDLGGAGAADGLPEGGSVPGAAPAPAVREAAAAGAAPGPAAPAAPRPGGRVAEEAAGASERAQPGDPRLEVGEGFFRYGLALQGYERLRSAADDLPPAVLLAYARRLNERGMYLESIRLIYRLQEQRRASAGRPPGAALPPAGPEELRLLYPQAYGKEIEALARQIGFDPAVFFALVREESHFAAAIVSRAGAVGLTQLMPATARDLAGRLKLGDPDLRDPQTNLRLGSVHLDGLYSRLQDIPKTLMAYNAGLSRLRRWEEKLAGLPTDLLAEAVPFEETRHYLRKILVSALYYGYLYERTPPAETVRRFYPHFDRVPGEEGR